MENVKIIELFGVFQTLQSRGTNLEKLITNDTVEHFIARPIPNKGNEEVQQSHGEH